MGTTAVYAFPYPEDGVTAQGPSATQALANAIEAAYTDTTWTTYTPAWTSAGTIQPGSPTTIFGRYRLDHGWCDVAIGAMFGPSTSGGNGALRFSLPFAASSAINQQILVAKTWLPANGLWGGIGVIDIGGTVVRPHFGAVSTQCNLQAWQSAETPSGGTATGWPQVAGYSIQNGGNCYVSGRYRL